MQNKNTTLTEAIKETQFGLLNSFIEETGPVEVSSTQLHFQLVNYLTENLQPNEPILIYVTDQETTSKVLATLLYFSTPYKVISSYTPALPRHVFICTNYGDPGFMKFLKPLKVFKIKPND